MACSASGEQYLLPRPCGADLRAGRQHGRQGLVVHREPHGAAENAQEGGRFTPFHLFSVPLSASKSLLIAS